MLTAPVMRKVVDVNEVFTIYEDNLGVYHTWNNIEDCWDLTFLSVMKAIDYFYDKSKCYWSVTL